MPQSYGDYQRGLGDQSRLQRVYTPKDGGQAELHGTIEAVRLVNVGDGWGFGRVYIDKHRLVVSFTGMVEDLYIDAKVRLKGAWAQHAKYGWQVKLTLVEVVEPTTADAARAWLIHRMPEVGEYRASRIMRKFPPPQLWDVLENDPRQLVQIQGISIDRAEDIGRAYETWKAEREQFVALAELGLKPAQVRQAVRRWQMDAEKRVRANPYDLRQLDGFGWKATDTIARKMGLKKSDPRRIRAGIGYAAEVRERDGHCCSSSKKLMSVAGTSDILGLSPRHIVPEFQAAVDARLLIEDETGFFRPETYASECLIAEGVARLLQPQKG